MPHDLPGNSEPLVPVLFTTGGLLSNLEPGSMLSSVFELVTAEYDLRHSPSNPANEIPRLAADRQSFRRVRQELEKHVIEVGTETQLFRVRDHEGLPDEPWPSHGMRGHPNFPAAPGECGRSANSVLL